VTSDRIPLLREALSRPLPGHGSFLELSGYQRPDLSEVEKRDPPPRRSAVLILLHERDGVLHTLLMKRPDYDGVHSGQIAFPGGHFEPSDRDLHQTALREFMEETGAPSNDFDVLGELSRVFIPPSNTLVTPVVAYAKQVDRFAPDPREVAALIDVPVSDLMRTDVLKRTNLFIHILKREAEVPYWDVQGHVVWGATALMIAELRELLHRLGEPA
jgi:8-oxo-dGTP pyrophosphatase MutT (NUDIX family)